MPDNQLAGVIGVNPYGVKEYLAASRNYKLGKVIDVFAYIKEADLRFKGVDSGSIDEGEILRELVYKILHWISKSQTMKSSMVYIVHSGMITPNAKFKVASKKKL